MVKLFTIGLIVAVLILAVYIIFCLDDKLQKERYEHKYAVRAMADENSELQVKLVSAELERMKSEQRRQAMQMDYDLLLTDYHLLEGKMA